MDEYSPQRVLVGPNPPETHTTEQTSFTGKKIGELPAPPGDEELHSFHFTLYQTPQETYLLHAQEYIRKGSMERGLGEEPAEDVLIRRELCSEEEARRKYPKVIEMILERFSEKQNP